MLALAAIVSAVERVTRGAAALCLAGMLALVLAQVGLRYSGAGVPAFTEELARYAMIWMTLLAMAVAVREGSHIGIDFIPATLRAKAPRAANWLEALFDLLSVALFIILIWQGIDMVSFAFSQRSEGLQIRLAYPYVIMPIAFLLAALFALSRRMLKREAA